MSSTRARAQLSPPAWSHLEARQTFVRHKGEDFGKVLPLDFHARGPADPGERSFRVTAAVT